MSNKVENLYNTYKYMNNGKQKNLINAILENVESNSNNFKCFSKMTNIQKAEFILIIIDSVEDKKLKNELTNYLRNLNVDLNNIDMNNDNDEEINNILDNIKKESSKLSIKNKNKLLSYLDDNMAYIYRLLSEQKIEKCSIMGHKFDSWKTYTYNEEVPVWDAGYQGTKKVPVSTWSHTCTTCGFHETVDIEPLEVKTAREKKETEEKIEYYKQKIKKLENK